MSYNIKNFAETANRNGVNLAIYKKLENGTYKNEYIYIPNAEKAQEQFDDYDIEPKAISKIVKDEKTGKRYALIKILIEYVPKEKDEEDESPKKKKKDEKPKKEKKQTNEQSDNDDGYPF